MSTGVVDLGLNRGVCKQFHNLIIYKPSNIHFTFSLLFKILKTLRLASKLPKHFLVDFEDCTELLFKIDYTVGLCTDVKHFNRINAGPNMSNVSRRSLCDSTSVSNNPNKLFRRFKFNSLFITDEIFSRDFFFSNQMTL